ncbi:inversin-like [Watersipora subatra]|uniref:inversin-like n=1 Tax=Watersipora subatra TaxID=2589382 RepID=UPI00355B1EF7
MEGMLKDYVRERKLEISALRAALESVQPAELLRLLITIKHDSYSAVMLAADGAHTETCRLLLSPIRRTADELLWMKEKDGWTALHLAVLRGDNSECVELLIDTVSDERKYEFVSEKDEDGYTAIAVAAMWGRSKCIESLLYNFSSLQKDSLLNIQNNILYTPLHCAAYHGETTALKVMLGSVSLVTVSSLLNIKNSDKRTPLEEAEFRGKKESSELLKRWEKQPVVEALDDAKQQIKTLQKKTEQQAGALDDARQRITTLRIESDQKLSALRREGDQKVSALQRHTQQQAEDLAATQRKMDQFAAYLQTPGDTNLTDNQFHDPDMNPIQYNPPPLETQPFHEDMVRALRLSGRTHKPLREAYGYPTNVPRRDSAICIGRLSLARLKPSRVCPEVLGQAPATIEPRRWHNRKEASSRSQEEEAELNMAKSRTEAYTSLPSSNEVCINLQGKTRDESSSSSDEEEKHTDIPLHFNPRWDQGEIVLNTLKNGEWGDEAIYPLPEAFYPGRQFYVQFNVGDDGYESSKFTPAGLLAIESFLLKLRQL